MPQGLPLTANSAPTLPVNPAPGLAPIALLPWEETGDYTALHQALIAHHAPEGPVQVRVLYAGQEVACHAQSPLRRASVIDHHHLVGIVGASSAGISWLPRPPTAPAEIPPALLRPLEQYEAVLGGAW
jgi:hypothetical protein